MAEEQKERRWKFVVERLDGDSFGKRLELFRVRDGGGLFWPTLVIVILLAVILAIYIYMVM